MLGCLTRLGCLGVIVVGGLAYVTRDMWVSQARARFDGRPATAAVGDTATWQSLTPQRAERGERAVRALAGRRGPVFVNLRAGELASYAFLTLSDVLPPAMRDAQAAVVGDRVYVRTVVSPSDFAGILGGVGSFMADRDTLRLGGTFEVLRPGTAQLRVLEVQLGGFPVPTPLIPRIVARVRRGATVEGLAADALAVPIPEYIGDVRIARGRITLYRATP